MVRRSVLVPLHLVVLALVACSADQITGPHIPPGLPPSRTVATAFPVARKIAFVRLENGQNDIWVTNPDGTGQTNITNDPGSDGGPSWSPDGTKIVFASTRDDINYEIYVMNADGTGVTRLTNNAFPDGMPAWSPAGDKIAFVSQRSTESDQEIYVMNADGTNLVRLTTHAGDDRKPTWSPDGTKLAFHNIVDWDIYTMNANGSGLIKITNSVPLQDSDPAWSPDGSRIAFTRNSDIYVMNPDGSGSAWLAGGSAPAWSPNGTRIAFERFISPEFPSELYVMNADGTNQVNVGNTPEGVYSYWPNWSGPRDSDNDGIADVIDTSPSAPSLAFSDIPLGGATAGSIESLPANTAITIDDATPGGILVTTSATGSVAPNARAVIKLTGKVGLEKLAVPGTYLITDPATSTTVSVGSGGPAEVEVIFNGSPIVVSIDEGASATVTETTNSSGALTDVTVSDVTGDSGDVTVNGEPVQPGEPPVSVAAVNAKLSVRRSQLTLTGSLTPGGSAVFNPGTSDVTLDVGNYSFVKTGGLTRNKTGAYTFDGTLPSAPGVELSLELKQAKGGGQWTVKATASPVSGFVNPVTVSLRVGDVAASTQVTASLR
ncbi:MAG TPA: hypothetical protein VFD22_08900 [Gemmatimonadaceae bacterium]|nr:hypothetical protein [Gemmatimonadaceae bacterium]